MRLVHNIDVIQSRHQLYEALRFMYPGWATVKYPDNTALPFRSVPVETSATVTVTLRFLSNIARRHITNGEVQVHLTINITHHSNVLLLFRNLGNLAVTDFPPLFSYLPNNPLLVYSRVLRQTRVRKSNSSCFTYCQLPLSFR